MILVQLSIWLIPHQLKYSGKCFMVHEDQQKQEDWQI